MTRAFEWALNKVFDVLEALEIRRDQRMCPHDEQISEGRCVPCGKAMA